MNRLNRVLAAVLAVQVVILVVLSWPGQSTAEGQRLFGDIQTEKIVGLTIRDAEALTVRMVKGPNGWVLPDADDFPVLEDKVVSLLDKIVAAQADRLVTRTRDSHKRLQVADEDYERIVEFELEDGTRHKLYLGSSPSFRVLHVRADDQDEVYLALGLSASDAGTGVTAWIDPIYFSVSQDDIIAITLENKNGRFEFERDEAGTWTMINLPAGETLLENNVASLATRISSLRMQRPLGREEMTSYGMDDLNARVILQTRDDQGNETTKILRVGGSPEDGEGFVVKSATSDYYVEMAEFTVGDLIDMTLQDFIEVPPTPTPEPSETPAPIP